MGYKTEINYILKCSSELEGLDLNSKKPGESLVVVKSGERTFVINSPIMIADHNWKVIGMCLITKTETSKEKTVLYATILEIFSEEESIIVSKLIRDAEKEKIKYL